MAPGTRSELTSLQEEDEQPTANTVVLNQHTTVVQEEERMSCLLQNGQRRRFSLPGRLVGGLEDGKGKATFAALLFTASLVSLPPFT